MMPPLPKPPQALLAFACKFGVAHELDAYGRAVAEACAKACRENGHGAAEHLIREMAAKEGK